MFDFLRRSTKPIMMIALFGFLATIIFSWGAGVGQNSPGGRNSNLAAVINGEEISWTQYNQVYENLISAERTETQNEITDAKRNEIHATAWSQLQYDKLIMQEVNKHNIIVTDNELYEFLKYSPPQDFIQSATFQTNGQFDYQKYINALADPSFASVWASYDPYFRSEIQKLKLQEMIIQAAHISDNEVHDYFVSLNEKIKVGNINVKYGAFSRMDLGITDEELESYYESNKEEYNVEEQGSLKVVSIEKKPSDLDWEEGKIQIQFIADSIAAGADFGELAKVYSEDGSAANGGDLGLFPQGQMVPAFDEMVFSMKSGDVSPPVKTRFGWHIIKNFGFKDEKQGDKTVKKVQASHILIKVYTSQETMDIANNQLQQFRADALELGFDEAAEKNNLTANTINPFFKGSNMQYLGRELAASDFAFNSESGLISPVMENASLQFVIQALDKIPAGIAPFEKSKTQVKQDVRVAKIQTMCADSASAVWTDIQNGTKMSKAAKNHGFEYLESESFARGGYVKGLSNFPAALGAAFALENVGDVSNPVDYPQGTVIFKLLEKTPLDLTVFTAQKDSLSTILLTNKQQELFGRWFENLVKNSEIVNNISAIRSGNQNN